MDLATEISVLRQWLLEDETRLSTVPVKSLGTTPRETRGGAYDFNQFGDRADPFWNKFDQWGNQA